MREKNGLDELVINKKKEIKIYERAIEYKKEELIDLEKSIPSKKGYIDELIKATEASITSLQTINANKN